MFDFTFWVWPFLHVRCQVQVSFGNCSRIFVVDAKPLRASCFSENQNGWNWFGCAQFDRTHIRELILLCSFSTCNDTVQLYMSLGRSLFSHISNQCGSSCLLHGPKVYATYSKRTTEGSQLLSSFCVFGFEMGLFSAVLVQISFVVNDHVWVLHNPVVHLGEVYIHWKDYLYISTTFSAHSYLQPFRRLKTGWRFKRTCMRYGGILRECLKLFFEAQQLSTAREP